MDFLDRIRTRAAARARGSYLGERIRKGICSLQHDMNAANGSGATVRADLNNALESLATVSSGASAPSTTFAYQLWADTTNGLLKQRNAANSGWLIRGTLAEVFVVARSSNTIIAIGDIGKTFICTSTFTQTLTAVATLGDGFWVNLKNDGSGIITVDANSTELIDGLQALVLQPGESCTLFCNGSTWKVINRSHLAGLNKTIWGWTYANNGADAINDIDIAAGGGLDATGLYWIKTAALTKRLDAAWAVGSGNGGLDTGAVGNSDYYLWVIARSDTGVTDALFSLSGTAPTMPSGYDYKELVGWFRRSGGAILAFTAYEMAGGGLEYQWSAPILDVNLTNTLTTARRTDALSVPQNFTTIAHIRTFLADAAANFVVTITNPDETDAAPSVTASPGFTVQSPGVGLGTGFSGKVRTSATGTVASRANLATVDTYRIFTVGFEWSRR